MSTAGKLWLGFGTLTALLVLVCLTITLRVTSVDREVREMADARNLSAATTQLEIDTLGYALSVRAYLQTGDAEPLRQIGENAAAVDRHLHDYEQLEPSDRRRQMAARFAPLWQELKTLGDALVDPEGTLLRLNHSRRFFELRSRLEKLLAEEMQVDALATYNQHKDDALADVQDIRNFALALLFGGGLVGLLTSVAVGRGVVGTDRLLRENQERLRRNAAELSDADNRKDEFIAMLAHELRNPLAPISNALQVLRLADAAGKPAPQMTAMMERQVGQMIRLVDDLLDVSRISRGKIELRKGAVELASTVHHAVEAARPLHDDKKHRLTVSLPAQPIYLDADPARMHQIIGNLLHNAAKFTERGGSVALIVEPEPAHVNIRVRDSGIGISAEQLPRVFELFVQADTSLGRAESGVGIGLALVKQLVEMHGGTVAVTSPGLGQGSEFVVRLPTITAPTSLARATPPVASTAERQGGRRRILVVDDNHESAESLAVLLELDGHETRTVADGLAAVEAAASWRPEVMLLDIGLPGLNGYEVAQAVRKQPWGKRMVLVALTGWGQAEDRRKSREAGFDGHLVKPASHASIVKMLDDFPDGGGATRGA